MNHEYHVLLPQAFNNIAVVDDFPFEYLPDKDTVGVQLYSNLAQIAAISPQSLRDSQALAV